MPRFNITPAEYAAGTIAGINGLEMQLPHNRLAKASMAAVEAGNLDAYFVPAANYLLDTTLGVITQPSVDERLPPEVSDRSIIAQACLNRIGGEAARTGLYTAGHILYCSH